MSLAMHTPRRHSNWPIRKCRWLLRGRAACARLVMTMQAVAGRQLKELYSALSSYKSARPVLCWQAQQPCPASSSQQLRLGPSCAFLKCAHDMFCAAASCKAIAGTCMVRTVTHGLYNHLGEQQTALPMTMKRLNRLDILNKLRRVQLHRAWCSTATVLMCAC